MVVVTGIDAWTNEVHQGDAIETLREVPASSVHAVVTDPPYGLAFMPERNEWDEFESPVKYQEWCERWGRAVSRVLKPGGHLIAFGGDRTHHRLFAGLEDAGLEIRHTIPWLFADNFPKDTRSLLKPCAEFPALARNPLDGSVEDTVDEHGTGALNIDACRIPLSGDDDTGNWSGGESGEQNTFFGPASGYRNRTASAPDGRYPPTVTMDEAAAKMLDAQTGRLESGTTDFTIHEARGRNRRAYGARPLSDRDEAYYGDAGGASRFFYVAKATEGERTLDGRIVNEHPTVKPVSLLEWHVKLVSREDQIVLDPFAGTGTTGVACKQLNRRFILVERAKRWCAVSRARTGLSFENPALLRDDATRPLDAFADADAGGDRS